MWSGYHGSKVSCYSSLCPVWLTGGTETNPASNTLWVMKPLAAVMILISSSSCVINTILLTSYQYTNQPPDCGGQWSGWVRKYVHATVQRTMLGLMRGSERLSPTCECSTQTNNPPLPSMLEVLWYSRGVAEALMPESLSEQTLAA